MIEVTNILRRKQVHKINHILVLSKSLRPPTVTLNTVFLITSAKVFILQPSWCVGVAGANG